MAFENLTRGERNLKVDLYFGNDLGRTPGGDIRQVTARSNLKQAILNRLITVPGSITHRPNYGIGLLEYQNALGSLQTQTEIMLKIQAQLTLDPRISSIEGLRFIQSENNTGQWTMKLTIFAVGLEREVIEYVI